MNIDPCPCGASVVRDHVVTFHTLRKCCFVYYYGRGPGDVLYAEAARIRGATMEQPSALNGSDPDTSIE